VIEANIKEAGVDGISKREITIPGVIPQDWDVIIVK
jgi:hypothetical protein